MQSFFSDTFILLSTSSKMLGVLSLTDRIKKFKEKEKINMNNKRI